MRLDTIDQYSNKLIKKSYIRDGLYLLVVLGGLFFSFMGDRPLANPDEGRYVEISREMTVTNNFITPRLNGLKYFEKPPLVYWLESIPLKLGFTSEFALRFPIAVIALFGCLLVYGFTRHLYSRMAGLWSSIILGTSILYFSLARLILLDLVLTVFLTGALLSFLTGFKSNSDSGRRIFFALSSIFMALAVLTKGLIGIVIPCLVIGVWILCLNLWKKLIPLFFLSNFSLFLLIAAPWHILVYLETPEFFNYYFIHEHVLRYLTTVHNRYQPVWFFVAVILIGFLPWTVFLPRSLKSFLPTKWKQLKILDVEIFILLWVIAPLIFFSFSSSSLIPYILPIFPALSIICGRFVAYKWRNNMSLMPEFLAGSVVWVCLCIIGTIYFNTLEYLDPGLWTQLSPYITILTYVIIGSAILIPFFAFKLGMRWGLCGLLFTHIILLFVVNHAGQYIQKETMKHVAASINQSFPPHVPVIFYGGYRHDLAPYLGRIPQIAGWKGELEFGTHLEPQNKIMITSQSALKSWHSMQPVCVVVKKNFLMEFKNAVYKKPIVIYEGLDWIALRNIRSPKKVKS